MFPPPPPSPSPPARTMIYSQNSAQRLQIKWLDSQKIMATGIYDRYISTHPGGFQEIEMANLFYPFFVYKIHN